MEFGQGLHGGSDVWLVGMFWGSDVLEPGKKGGVFRDATSWPEKELRKTKNSATDEYIGQREKGWLMILRTKQKKINS